jgi:predicted nucleotidyltransferase
MFFVRGFASPRKSSETQQWPFELNSSVGFMSGDMKARLEKFLLKVRDDPEILAIFLFGSAARGEQGPTSDVDTCLMFAPGISDRLHMAQKRLDYMSEAPDGLDIQVFQLLPLYIRHRILKEGKVLFCREEDALYDIAFATIKAFEDFRHIYREYLDEVARG